MKHCPNCNTDKDVSEFHSKRSYNGVYYRRFLCKPCERLARRNNRPLLTSADRLWAKVNKTETCWLWTGMLNEAGYGVSSHQGKNILAHRFAYLLIKGDLGTNKHIDHLCENPRCVNPDHLELVNAGTNTIRSSVTNRFSHCKRGHELSEDNIYQWTNKATGKTGRYCAKCHGLRAKSKRGTLQNPEVLRIALPKKERRIKEIHPAHMAFVRSGEDQKQTEANA